MDTEQGTEQGSSTAEPDESLLDYSDEDEEEENLRRLREREKTDMSYADQLEINRTMEERKRRRAAEKTLRLQKQKEKAEKESGATEVLEKEKSSKLAADKDLEKVKREREEAMEKRRQASLEAQHGEKLKEARILAENDKKRKADESSSTYSAVDTVAGASLLNLPPGYRAVRSSKLSSLAVRPLEGGSVIPFKPIGAFANDYDTRIKNAHTSLNSISNWNISTSFNMETLTCKTCTTKGEHTVLGRKAAGSVGTEQAPPCFVLSDQNFPPLVPAEGGGDCLKIIQIENASLSDLTKVFLGTVEGFAMPAGTVVLICSVSHLAAVGTAMYAEDLVRAFKTLRHAYGTGISVMHGIPILISGLDNKNTIRELLEIDHWYNSARKSDTRDITKTRALCYGTLLEKGTCTSTAEELSAPEVRPLMLPQNLGTYEKFSYRTKGFSAQVTTCPPVSVEEESKILTSLVKDLNEMAGLDMATDIRVDRTGLDEQLGEDLFSSAREKIVFIGSSHGSRASDNISPDEFEVVDLTSPGWRISEASVDEMVESLQEELYSCDEEKTTIVFQLFDNSSYWVRHPDGSRNLPEKCTDRNYHVDGKLEVADKEDAKRMVSMVARLLRAGKNCRKLVLTPLPRWLHIPCCNLVEHCTNIADVDYSELMGGKLSDLRHFINESIRMKGIKKVKILQSAHLLNCNGEAVALWGEDPVHLTPDGYCVMAKGIEYTVKRMKDDEQEKQEKPPAKKVKIDRSELRPEWVKGKNGTIWIRNNFLDPHPAKSFCSNRI